MKPPAYLVDEDFNYQIVRGVRRSAPEVKILTVTERGWSSLADGVILDRAASEGLIVLSHDVNTMTAAAFARISDRSRMTGLFLSKQNESVAEVIQDLLLIAEASSADEWFDRVEFLPL